MYATNILYNINLLSLYDDFDDNHQTISFKFCYKFSFDNNTQKDLCILTNCYNHYNLLYSKNYNIIKNNNILIFYYNKLSTNTKEKENKINNDKDLSFKNKIYSFLLSKNNQVRNWPAKITEIDDTNKRNEAKTNFRNYI